jgi:hypothetical protein
MTSSRKTGDFGVFGKEPFRFKVEDLTLLPAISPRVREVMARLDDPEANVAGISGEIEKDPVLSARILKVKWRIPRCTPRGGR